jgi:HWE histidine kinase
LKPFFVPWVSKARAAVQTLRGAANKEAVCAFEGRILALSKAHGLLGRKVWEAVSLRDVIDQILQPFGLNDRRVIRFSVEGDDVRLQPKAELTLAMVFHELATKQPSTAHSRTAARERSTLLGRLSRPAWPDAAAMAGKRRAAGTPPGRKGFGSRVIEGGLARELDGEVRLDHEPPGVVCQIIMPRDEIGLGHCSDHCVKAIGECSRGRESRHTGLDSRYGDGIGFAHVITRRRHQSCDRSSRGDLLQLLIAGLFGATAPGRPLADHPLRTAEAI